MKYIWIITFSIVLLVSSISFVKLNEPLFLSGEEVYKTYCAGCHGANMEGNLAESLIKSEWTYGASRNLIFRNIKFGIPNTEMVAWESFLSDNAINKVVDYVIESQEIPPHKERIIPGEIETKDYQIKVEVLVEEGIKAPWAIEFVNKNTALITEKHGGLKWMKNGVLDTQRIAGLPVPYTKSSTAGLMDIALDPHYKQNGWIYLAFSHTDEEIDERGSLSMTKVIRGRIHGYQWLDEETLFEADESLRVEKGNRWGCRLLFDKEGKLYFSIGDMGRADDSQDLTKVTGKVFRINSDGTIPNDNPFVKDPDAISGIFTYGNRNVQGLALHPATGEIWATEHGPMGGDELNILEKGKNYGWPVITYGLDYDGDEVSSNTHQKGMEQPIEQWTPSIAICPSEFSTSKLFPNWKNDLFVGALAFEEIRRLDIKKNEVVDQEIILKGYGRVRDLKFGPDGALYVLLNKPDKVLRLSPINGI